MIKPFKFVFFVLLIYCRILNSVIQVAIFIRESIHIVLFMS